MASIADITNSPELLHGQETGVWGDQAYRAQRAVIRRNAPRARDARSALNLEVRNWHSSDGPIPIGRVGSLGFSGLAYNGHEPTRLTLSEV
jgi:hypothetical protein